MISYEQRSAELDIGSHVPVHGPRATWDATVTASTLAMRVEVSFVLRCGATRRRPFFAGCDVPGYFKELPDGGAAIYAFE